MGFRAARRLAAWCAAMATVCVALSCATTQGPERADRPDRRYAYAGVPAERDVTVLRNEGFLVGYSEARGCPRWVAYRVFRVGRRTSGERPSRFGVDERTRARVRHEDYTGSGCDRGHMAPNYAIATRYGRRAQLETFLMSNIAPQKPGLNRGPWRLLEERVARKWAEEFEEVWVITGPIFAEGGWRLAGKVDVPSGFYKIVLDEERGRPRVWAFVMPQAARGEPDAWRASVDRIEALTGLDFLADLPDELEAEIEREVAR
jgi:endonuclease G